MIGTSELIWASFFCIALTLWILREILGHDERYRLLQENNYLEREIRDQQKRHRSKIYRCAEIINMKKKLKEEDEIDRNAEWNKMWVAIFDKSPGMWSEALDEKGKCIWDKAAEYAFDMRQHRGFTLGQVKSIHGFSLALVKAIKDEQRTFESLCPTGEIEFDAEGGIKGMK